MTYEQRRQRADRTRELLRALPEIHAQIDAAGTPGALVSICENGRRLVTPGSSAVDAYERLSADAGCDPGELVHFFYNRSIGVPPQPHSLRSLAVEASARSRLAQLEAEAMALHQRQRELSEGVEAARIALLESIKLSLLTESRLSQNEEQLVLLRDANNALEPQIKALSEAAVKLQKTVEEEYARLAEKLQALQQQLARL